jgi:hypothetical protein
MQPTGQIQDACCDFETVESVNNQLYRSLHDIVATPYFRYHKVSLFTLSLASSISREQQRRGASLQFSSPHLFALSQVDLYRECPFWQEDGSCMNRACGVETTDEVTRAPPSSSFVELTKPASSPGTHSRSMAISHSRKTETDRGVTGTSSMGEMEIPWQPS